jgi:hypothetical protein
MRKSDRRQPLLNTLARGIGHIAGSVARATQELTAHDLAESTPVSSAKEQAGHAKRRKKTAQKRKRVSAPSQHSSVRKMNKTQSAKSEKKR